MRVQIPSFCKQPGIESKKMGGEAAEIEVQRLSIELQKSEQEEVRKLERNLVTAKQMHSAETHRQGEQQKLYQIWNTQYLG